MAAPSSKRRNKMSDFVKFLNKEVLNAQEVFAKKEKAAWAKFEATRDAKYEGKGSRAIKKEAINAARVILAAELEAAENDYAKEVGAA